MLGGVTITATARGHASEMIAGTGAGSAPGVRSSGGADNPADGNGRRSRGRAR
jgi:hypothetical protein